MFVKVYELTAYRYSERNDFWNMYVWKKLLFCAGYFTFKINSY